MMRYIAFAIFVCGTFHLAFCSCEVNFFQLNDFKEKRNRAFQENDGDRFRAACCQIENYLNAMILGRNDEELNALSLAAELVGDSLLVAEIEFYRKWRERQDKPMADHIIGE